MSSAFRFFEVEIEKSRKRKKEKKKRVNLQSGGVNGLIYATNKWMPCLVQLECSNNKYYVSAFRCISSTYI